MTAGGRAAREGELDPPAAERINARFWHAGSEVVEYAHRRLHPAEATIMLSPAMVDCCRRAYPDAHVRVGSTGSGRWPNLVYEEIPTRDHMFRAIWLQRHVHASPSGLSSACSSTRPPVASRTSSAY